MKLSGKTEKWGHIEEGGIKPRIVCSQNRGTGGSTVEVKEGIAEEGHLR